MMDMIVMVIIGLFLVAAVISLIYSLYADVSKPHKESKSKKASPVETSAKKPTPAVVQEQRPAPTKLPPDPRTEALLRSTEKELRMNLLAQDAFWQMAQISRYQSQPQPESAKQRYENGWGDEWMRG